MSFFIVVLTLLGFGQEAFPGYVYDMNIPSYSGYHVFSRAEVQNAYQYGRISYAIKYEPAHNMLFDPDYIDLLDVAYDYLTERGYTNQLYEGVFESGALQYSLIDNIITYKKQHERNLSDIYKKRFISMLGRVKEFEQISPNPFGTPGEMEEMIDRCIAELQK